MIEQFNLILKISNHYGYQYILKDKQLNRKIN
jgi:hypothetical protein